MAELVEVGADGNHVRSLVAECVHWQHPDGKTILVFTGRKSSHVSRIHFNAHTELINGGN